MTSTALIRSTDADQSTVQLAAHYARLGTSFASVANAIGFGAAKNGAHLSFSVMRGLATAAISVTSSYAEKKLLGRKLGTDKYLNSAVRRSLRFAENLTLIPLDVAEKVVDTSLVVATCTIDGVSFVLGLPKPNEDDFAYNIHWTARGAEQQQPGDAEARPISDDDLVGEFFGPFSATAPSFTYTIPSILRFIRYEWDHPDDPELLPSESYTALAVIRGTLAFAAIQRVTRVHHERKWFKAMKEIQDWEWRGQKDPRPPAVSPTPRLPRSRRNTIRGRPGSAVHVVSDVHLPNNAGEILTAEIGVPADAELFSNRNYRLSTASFSRMSFASTMDFTSGVSSSPEPAPISPGEKPKMPYPVLRNALRRFSRMVLGGYGGLPVAILGLQIPKAAKKAVMEGNLSQAAKEIVGQNLEDPEATGSTTSNGNGRVPLPTDERTRLERVVDVADQVESDDDDDGSSAWNILEPPSPTNEEFHHNPSVKPDPPSYSWWNLLLGKHDEDVFHAFATSGDGSATPKMSTSSFDFESMDVKTDPEAGEKKSSSKPSTTHAGVADRVPRFWVLTDHARQQIVLVLRGTMSLNEVAVDLACDVAPFKPARTSNSPPDSRSPSPTNENGASESEDGPYHVHAGMYALASAMAAPGKPVHEVVAKAMMENPEYELVLCGHSLGAGVATLIALMWADPDTCLTVRSGGLPENRPVSVFCFAPPCVCSPALSRACRSLITSFAYSNDFITRLSKGSVRDVQRAANWLAYEQQRDPDSKESCGSIIRRAIMLERGYNFLNLVGDPEVEEAWFLALRKTLEAQMRYVDLFPPGRVIWAMRDSSFHAAFRRTPALANPNMPRVFEVEKVEEVFGQIVFAPDMVISHLVNLYDDVLHDFL